MSVTVLDCDIHSVARFRRAREQLCVMVAWDLRSSRPVMV